MSTIIIVVLIIALITITTTSVFIISRLTNIIYDIGEQIEESLDLIDKSYHEIGRVLTFPIFHDDPVVRQTVGAIKRAHNALLLVANKISAHPKLKLKKQNDRSNTDQE